MNPRGTATSLALAGLLAAQNDPRIGYVYPAGLAPGATAEVVVGGRALQGVHGARIAGLGWTAEFVDYQRPMTQQERNAAREEIQRLTRLRQEKKLEPEDESKLVELRKKLATNPRQQPNPQIAETVRLRLTLAADAAPGARDLRLLGPAGLTNPVRFVVSPWREWLESEPNEVRTGVTVPAKLPLVINGQILPGDVDRFRIRAHAGALAVTVSARALIPYLADAVPGWFQATLTLEDENGREVAFADDHRQSPDPVLHYQVPADGEYILEIRDALYRGREDFVYRLTVAEVPLVTGVFPLGGKARTATRVHLEGWNIPADQAALPVPAREPGVRPLTLGPGQLAAGTIAFATDELPEGSEQEPNDTPAAAQQVTLPVIVNGRLGRPGDRDVFRIDGHAGYRLVAEVMARRLDSPLDSILTLTDAHGKELAVNDDHEDPRAGLATHHADSWLSVRLPAEGVYYLQLRDVQGHGSSDHAYRLRLGPPQADFALRVVPSAINLRAGATTVVTVHALRLDGFAGDITLALDRAPPGLTLGGATIPGSQGAVRVTLTAPADLPLGPVPLAIVGRASFGGKEVQRPALAADDLMQAFAYRHLVPADELLLTVARGGRGPRIARRDDTPVRIPLGGTAEVLFNLPRRPAVDPDGFRFALKDPPAGITVAGTSLVEAGLKLTLRADAKAPAGLRGNLIVEVFQERTTPASRPAQARRQSTPLGTLPALRFELKGP